MSSQLDESTTNIFLFTLDQGPDNVGATKFIKSLLLNKPHVMIMVTWCFMHQCHLIVKSALQVLDQCRWWCEPGNVEYFSSVSAVSNCWRTAGHPQKIYEKACAMFGDVAGRDYAKKIPGRVPFAKTNT